MKRVVILLAVFLLFPLISAEIIISQQPNIVYSLGDVITIPTVVKTSKDVSGIYQMDLVCIGIQKNFYRHGINLQMGEEKEVEASLILTEEIIGKMRGLCKIKAFIAEDFALTNEFAISDLIIIKTIFEKTEFSPGDTIIISGDAYKENGKPANGFIEASIGEFNLSKVNQKGTISGGDFSLSLSIPKDMKAGNYLLMLNAYEEDLSGTTTNKGSTDIGVSIKQVPTSLEIIFESPEIEPGTNLGVRVVLHDQTGEKIASKTFISIKNGKNKILEQVEVNTDEVYEFPISYKELPSTWKVVAVSNKLESEAVFTITEKEAISIEIINKTVIITNMGNVVYNKTAFVKIGEEPINIDVYLKVGESQKYLLTAPDGSYNIEIVSGEERAGVQGVTLTGNAVDIKKSSGSTGSLINSPFVWIFILVIFGLAVLIYIKGRNKTNFFGYANETIKESSPKVQKVNTKPKVENNTWEEVGALTKGSLISSRNRAEVSTSIKGEEQEASAVALRIKSLKEVESREGNAKETLQKVVDMAEERKAVTYEDHNTVIFLLAPTITKNSENETRALEIAQKTREIILNHNKLFKQKISFGISLDKGRIVGKKDGTSFKFTGMNSFMPTIKKISSLADNEILLGERINDRLRTHIKSTKETKSGVNVYSIKEIKNVEQNSKFIKSFTERFSKEQKE